MNLIQCSCMSHERLEFVLYQYDDMPVISDLTVEVIAPYPPIMLL